MSNRSRSFDVAVVGAGVIGLAVGWRAAQRGLDVIVLERAAEPSRETSSVAAGMLAPISETLATELPLMRLGMASADMYPEFVAELIEASGGADPGYLRCGTLLAGRDADEAESLARELELRQSLGLTVERLRGSEARRLEPALAPSLRLALHIPDDHAIDPRKLTAALARALTQAGGELRLGAPVGLEIEHERVTGVRLADGTDVTADNVVVAAGPWSSALDGVPAGASIPVHPIKGQILRLHDPAGPGLLTRVLRMTGGYLVPRGDGRYVLGATMEERGFDATVTAGGAFELLRNAFELLPSVTELVIDELSAGLRPATPDNAPAIGPGAIPGLHWATGHFRHGILLTPITAELVVGGLTGESAIPAEFAPTRFAMVAA